MKNLETCVQKKSAGPARKTDETAIIFDIQRFSIHDGPGIRTTIFFKGCPLRCAWCQNPESHRREPEMAFYAETCVRCFSCRKACSCSAIIDEEKRRIEHPRCDACGACGRACPTGSLRLVGAAWSVDSLADEVLKDRDFFTDSGGGITLSGGEPMMQAGFVRRLLRRFDVEKVPVLIETCGVFRWTDMETILPLVGAIYFDLKQIDPDAHRRYTGAGNREILENFTRLTRAFDSLTARMPVIPGINDDRDSIRAMARFLIGAGHRVLHCLPYHNLGEAKLSRINTALSPLGLESLAAERLRTVKMMFKKEGIDAVIYD